MQAVSYLILDGVHCPTVIISLRLNSLGFPEFLVSVPNLVLSLSTGVLSPLSHSVDCLIRKQAMSGPQCCENPPTLSSSSGSGCVEQLGGLNTYISGSPQSKAAIILASDIFGYEAPKLRELADKVAAAGFYVVVPDFFYGDPYNPENIEMPVLVWIKSHGPDKGTDDCRQVIAALESKGILRIGVAGFCWGAKVAVELAKEDNIQAAVMLHPSFVTVEDIKEVKTPIAVLGAELDHLSPPALIKQFDEVLSAKPEVHSLVKIFPRVAHGWTVRYTDEDETSVKSAEEAHDSMIDWFVKYVK